MAVEDKYINTDQAAGDKTDAVLTGGGILVTRSGTFESEAADDDGSVYRLFTIPSNAVPVTTPTVSVIKHDNITGGTDFVCGLYEKGIGEAVVDADAFLTTTSFANTTDAAFFAVGDTVDKLTQAVFDYAGETTDPGKQYDVAITGNTVGAGGTITFRAQYLVQG
jgi:hypothetical protein